MAMLNSNLGFHSNHSKWIFNFVEALVDRPNTVARSNSVTLQTLECQLSGTKSNDRTVSIRDRSMAVIDLDREFQKLDLSESIGIGQSYAESRASTGDDLIEARYVSYCPE